MPPLAAEDQHLALALYRHLARGEPVATVALAAAMERDPAEVDATLARWPGVYRGDDDRILAFWGLALPEMAHRFRLDGRQFYTWCAWDALFIPELIGETAHDEQQRHADRPAAPLREDRVAPDVGRGCGSERIGHADSSSSSGRSLVHALAFSIKKR